MASSETAIIPLASLAVATPEARPGWRRTFVLKWTWIGESYDGVGNSYYGRTRPNGFFSFEAATRFSSRQQAAHELAGLPFPGHFTLCCVFEADGRGEE